MAEDFNPNKYTNSDLYDRFRTNEIRQILLAKGISQQSIDAIGDCDVAGGHSLDEGIMKAAQLFRIEGHSSFSGPELAMMLFSDTWAPSIAKRYKTENLRCLIEMFGDESKYKSIQYDMRISPIQILREYSGNYSGNLYEAREFWKKFVPSETDFRESTRIPTLLPNTDRLRFNDNVNYALGAIYAGGFAAKSGSAKHPCRLVVRGDKHDVAFFENGLPLMITSCFNTAEKHRNEDRPTRDRKGSYKLPFIKIDSMAVASWLVYDLGFPRVGTRNAGKQFPDIVLGEHAYVPFMSGFISLKGTPHDQRGSLRFCSRDIGLLNQAAEQIDRANVPVSRVYEDATSPFIEVSKTNIEKLFGEFDIRNPKLRKLTS